MEKDLLMMSFKAELKAEIPAPPSSWTIKDQGGFIGRIQTDLGVITLLAAIGRVSAPKMIHPDYLIGLNKCFLGVAPAD